MHHVEVRSLPLERMAEVIEPERARLLMATAQEAREVLGARTVWNISATAQGGGVAEMLQTLLAYGRGAGVDTRWGVLRGDPEFFAVTKRLHNLLHGDPGDGGPLGEQERRHYEDVLRANLAAVNEDVRPGDVVLLHDPQTAGLVDGVRAAGGHAVWRCHIGRDTRNEHTDKGWAFLRPYVERAEATVWSRRQYAPDWVDAGSLWVVPPSIDPFTAKNCDLGPDEISDVLVGSGLVVDGRGHGAVAFPRRDGTPGRMGRHEDVLVGGTPPPIDARLVVQVSRWDRLKDMAGVLRGFAEHLDDLADDVHLVLAGPDVSGVTDDPEGAEVLRECSALWQSLPRRARDHSHLAMLPMDDLSENAVMVNALQRHAAVVVQKSLVEGFGLTVTEAMWKATPVVASAVGGIQDQIDDGRDGVLLPDPYDLGAYADAVRGLLADEDRAARIGAAGRERVRTDFLGDRHLIQYVDLFRTLVGGE